MKLEEISKKQKKKVNIQNFSLEEFEGDIDEIIEMLKGLKKEGLENIEIRIDQDLYDDSYVDINAYGYRVETDEEVQTKIDNWNKAELEKFLREEKAKEDKKKLYEELKKEFA